MKKIIIEGNKELTGTINISGAKNSAVALIPASILSDEGAVINNVPEISDTHCLIEILEKLNGTVNFTNDTMSIDVTNMENTVIPEELSRKLRASYYFMGALLGKYKRCSMFFPGGCNIGKRPIDFHIKGFEQMGAKVTIVEDKYTIEAEELHGANIYLDFASVGATINLMLAAVKAEGETVINNAAKEPEIVNVATFLNNMGAKITGAGTTVIKIQGVKRLYRAFIDIIPDRIEAGTYLIMGALVGKNLKIDNVIKEHLEALIAKLNDVGVKMDIKESSITVSKTDKMNPVNIKTLVYPGFPTDLGQPMCTLLTQCDGKSLFEETVWENRFGHVEYLNKMGANIQVTGTNAIVIGGNKLNGTDVVATDLRAGAALIAAGLVAEGETIIEDVEHILRGYENIVQKLTNVGAKISITE